MTIDEFKKLKIDAMKSHDAPAVSAYNAIITKLMLVTVEKRAKGEEMKEADVVAVLKKVEAEITEERNAFEKAGRGESVENLNKQLEIIKKYMPTFMSAEEIKKIILSLEDKTVPNVMKHFKINYAGKCDMKTVNEVLKSL